LFDPDHAGDLRHRRQSGKNRLFVRLDTGRPSLFGVGEAALNAFAKTVEAAIQPGASPWLR
jgi:siroheme synthase